MTDPLRFGLVEVRPATRELLLGGAPAKLGARAFDVLLALVERRGRVVGKNELLELVWPDVVVEENNLQVQISSLRKLLGPQVIATIPGRGYCFTAAADSNAVATAQPAAAVAAPPAPNAQTRLPAEPPQLFGRAQDLADVQALLREHRLVTITGAGGIGKTQLARAVAHALRDAYPDGVWTVELASVADAAHAFAAVAQPLGVELPAGRAPQQVLAQALARQQLLLVLDNCEHVIDNVALLADALLAAAPGVRVLATSQEPLKLRPEHQHRLGALAVPDEADVGQALRHGAVALFVARAQAVDPRFALDANNAAAVIDICRRLDGIPLAIELAAARVALLGVNGLRDRLGKRFQILTAGARFALRRHQTLHAALDWSHGLLSADEQAVFQRLGAFAGGCTLEAAQAIASDEQTSAWAVLDHLGALVDKSIVLAQGGSAPRYGLLETTRAYALEQLAGRGETERLLQRHAQVIADLFERAADGRFGEEGVLSESEYLDRVQPEIDNLRAALAWASRPDGDPELVMSMAANASEAFYRLGLGGEGLEWLRRMVPSIKREPAGGALVTRFWFALGAMGVGGRIDDDDLAHALAQAEKGCRTLDWQRRLYRVLLNKAWWYIERNEIENGEAALTEAIRLERPQWPAWLRSDRWQTQSHLAAQTGDLSRIKEYIAVMDGMLPLQGEEERRARLTISRAVDDNFCQQWAQAASRLVPLIDRLRSRRRQLRMAAWAYGHLVLALTELGKLDEAREQLHEALPLWRAAAIVDGWLYAVIRLLAAQGRIAEAMRLVGREEVSPYQRRFNDTLTTGVRARSRQLIEAAEPSAERREQWRREGAALDDAGVVALCYLAAGEESATSRE